MKLRLALPVAAAAALVAASSAAAFTPTNTYFAKQWYLNQDHAFDAWSSPPSLQPVKVGIVDSGVDCSLPDLSGQVVKSQSFVGGSACTDTQGHGTIVAGEIAGTLDSAGIVGLAYSSQLLVAKVVASDGSIPLKAEAAGIRWVVDNGAQVVNLSFGAVRDPLNPALDTYSKQEAQAVAYAVSKGAVVVAAVGNSDEAYTTPWEFASWPAALPHVLGVAALTHSGNVPDFSDRDPTYVDISAPGVDIFSTFPRALTIQQQGCSPQGYTDCAGSDYRDPEGTSFAAPQVSAAAAILLGLHPSLTANQVTTILERNADDVDPATGCASCPTGRDMYSGWGRLDVQQAVAALSGPLPPVDRFEPNDTVAQAHTLWGRKPAITAALDYWDDPKDVYRVKLARGQRVQAQARTRAVVSLALLSPKGKRLAGTSRPGRTQRVAYRAQRAGWYYLRLRLNGPGTGGYSLKLSKSKGKSKSS